MMRCRQTCKKSRRRWCKIKSNLPCIQLMTYKLCLLHPQCKLHTRWKIWNHRGCGVCMGCKQVWAPAARGMLTSARKRGAFCSTIALRVCEATKSSCMLHNMCCSTWASCYVLCHVVGYCLHRIFLAKSRRGKYVASITLWTSSWQI